jgi:hypothetical protein
VPDREPEIEQVLQNMVQAMAHADLDEVGRTTSRDDCVLSIGSDSSEWAEGYEEIMRLLLNASRESELGVAGGLEDVKAFREGAVGWGAGRAYFELDGTRVPVRLTVVVHQEDGEWKAVQSHASIGVPNERRLDSSRSLDGSQVTGNPRSQRRARVLIALASAIPAPDEQSGLCSRRGRRSIRVG